MRPLIAFCALFFLIGCKPQNFFNDPKSGTNNHSTPVATPTLNSAGLLKSNQDFDIQDIKDGRICPSVRNNTVTFRYHPWPNELVQFLSLELARFPLLPQILADIAGIYLVDFVWQGADQDVAGYTCHNGRTNRYVVWLNRASLVANRRNMGGIDQSYVFEVPSVREQQFDKLLATLFHELMHVVDFSMFGEGRSQDRIDQRIAMMDLSWLDDGVTSRFGQPAQETAPMNLSGAKPSFFDVSFDHIRKDGSPAFGLNSDVEQARRHLRFLRDQTNFLSPGTAINVLEDFAATMEIYYMMTRYGFSGPTITFSASGSVPQEVFATRTLFESSQNHRRKVCQIAQVVFGENCDRPPPRLERSN